MRFPGDMCDVQHVKPNHFENLSLLVMNPVEQGDRLRPAFVPQSYAQTPRFLSGAPLMFQYPSASSAPYMSGMTQMYLANPTSLHATSANLRGMYGFPTTKSGTFSSIQQSVPRLFPGLMPQAHFNACVANHAPVLGSPASSSVLGAPISTFTSPSVTLSQLPLIPITPTPSRGALTEKDQNVLVKPTLVKSIEPVSPRSVECFEDIKFDSLDVTLSSPKVPQVKPMVTPIAPPNLQKVKGALVRVRVSELEDTLQRKSMWRQSKEVHKLTRSAN